MDPNNYLLKVIKKADGHATDAILKVIRAEPKTRFFVEATGFNSAFLTLCINEKNCRIIFLRDDLFDTATRLTFIENCPVGRPPGEIYFYASQFGEEELKKYLSRKCSVLFWSESIGSLSAFKIKALATAFPDQLIVIGKDFNKLLISIMLDAPLTMLFKQNDFSTAEILKFAEKGGNRVAIVVEGFTDQELTDFKNSGALLLPEIVGA